MALLYPSMRHSLSPALRVRHPRLAGADSGYKSLAEHAVLDAKMGRHDAIGINAPAPAAAAAADGRVRRKSKRVGRKSAAALEGAEEAQPGRARRKSGARLGCPGTVCFHGGGPGCFCARPSPCPSPRCAFTRAAAGKVGQRRRSSSSVRKKANGAGSAVVDDYGGLE